ncbi:MAG TPA: hypothetical protein PKD59_17530 [Miltoncostaeaceae bacterium]|nr:hypothetical protein [Miltoncostaeaceae bacterium]
MTARRRGSALVEYLGAVVVVGAVMLGLIALRPHHPSRTPPVQPLDRLGVLVAAPPPPRVARAPRPARPRPPRPARPRPPRAAVLVPGWAVGW